MNAWLWFLIAAVAGVAGVSLLLLDRGQRTSHSRERRRWAALRGWQFADVDPVLPDRWQHGALGRGGSGPARDLVTGSLFTAAGRRLVHVFDHDPGNGSPAVLAAVHRRTPQAVVLELWLPTVEFPADAGLDLLGPVGDRYAFTSDLVMARPLITPELVALADDVGDDVPVMWIEDAWVVAAVAPNTAPSRLERLLRLLGDLADLVDGVHGSPDDDRPKHAARPSDPAAGAGAGGAGAGAAAAAGGAGGSGGSAAGAAGGAAASGPSGRGTSDVEDAEVVDDPTQDLTDGLDDDELDHLDELADIEPPDIEDVEPLDPDDRAAAEAAARARRADRVKDE